MSDWESGSEQESFDEKSFEEELEEVFEKRRRRRQTIKAVVFVIVGLIVAVVVVRFVPFPRLRRAPDPMAIGEQAAMGISSLLAVDDDALSDIVRRQSVARQNISDRDP
jgi:predicted nucleic acid-binding Zn ribbon protein